MADELPQLAQCSLCLQWLTNVGAYNYVIIIKRMNEIKNEATR
ncbi:hypothetical protein MRBBS_0244 [Marinobacter sp. BSs20148]|nr:hypothetical protein MRBBS_0244 [Marinobacter sp. BSs20148]